MEIKRFGTVATMVEVKTLIYPDMLLKVEAEAVIAESV
jgi:hypothetical protein